MYYHIPPATPMEDPRDVSEVLKDHMVRHRFTSYELAPRIGVTRATLGRWVREGRVPEERDKMLRAILTLIDEGRA